MHRTRSILLAACAAVMVAACGGARDAGVPARSPLDLPKAAVVAAERCARPAATGGGMVGFRVVDGDCLRSFEGFSDSLAELRKSGLEARKGTLDTGTTVDVADLFDWAEQRYPELFPTHQTNLVLSPYVYRYYAATGNHVAVDGERIYVQGPLSNGVLTFVGLRSEFFCLVYPVQCGEPPPPPPPPRQCTPVTDWTVAGNVCAPDAGTGANIDSGTTVTLVDSLGPVRGTAVYRCTDGTLTPEGTLSCAPVPPAACNRPTQWTVGGQTCTPDDREPTQIASGITYTFADSTGTTGRATYSCNDGTLTQAAGATCEPPGPVNCKPPTALAWTVGGNVCQADFFPSQDIADGAFFTFDDLTGDFTGRAAYQCVAGSLVASGTPTCANRPVVPDSFGGNGGTADGSASADGTAGEGAPIAGGTVRIVDTAGREVFATTDSIGYWRAKVTGFVPPLVVSVTKPGGGMLRSLSTQPIKINAYIFIAVTSLTEKIADDVARAAGAPGAASLTPAMVVGRESTIQQSISALENDPLIGPLIVAAGLNVETFDPLTVPFRADGSGYDEILDNVVLTTDSSGVPIFVSADCTVPPSWTVSGVTCEPDPGLPTAVPSGSSIVLVDTIGSTTGSVGYSCLKGVLNPPFLASCSITGSN